VFGGEAEKISVGYVRRPNDVFTTKKRFIGQGNIIWPKLMARVMRSLQRLQSLDYF